MFTRLRGYKIIPSIDNIDPDEAILIADALVEAELPVLEITYKNHSDAKVIRAILDRHPDFIIGAGGILNSDLVLRAADNKPKFMTSPGYNIDAIEEAKRYGIDYACGVCTPTDVINSITAGVIDMLFFPAQYFGGAPMLEELMHPFSHLNINILVKGGITMENIHKYLLIDTVAGIICPWIITDDIVQYKRWELITENASKALEYSKKQTVYLS